MTTKVAIVEEIGETGLLLPELINRGLSANDRLKYCLTLLQAAKTHAVFPQQPAPNLQPEREASRIDDAAFDDVAASSRRLENGNIAIPGLRRVGALMAADIGQMLAPLRPSADSPDAARARFDAYARRSEQLLASLPGSSDEEVSPAEIDALAESGGDSVHQLVMDLHRELNQLQATVSLESIDGARAYGLTEPDRALVRAFMQGVNETAGLRFDHPGLGTTATRIGERLSIQNDLGTTDAHVLVIHVIGLTTSVIYTDVHRKRARFLQTLMQSDGIEWQAGAALAASGCEMTVGRYTATDAADLERFLRAFGSRLVFLIDWNRARKRLARFVRGADAAAILKWAADNNVGHRAFLQAGDVRLIYTALERAAPAQLHYGARLDELLGREPAREFLKAVLRIVSDGLTAGRSLRLIQDEIEAELLLHLQAAEQSAIGAAAEHAALIFAIAERLRRALVRANGRHAAADAAKTAMLAKAWETRADEIVSRSTRLLDQSGEGHLLVRLLLKADDVTDALEETAFLLTLVPERTGRKGLLALGDLAELVARSAKEYVRCLEHARELSRSASRADVDDFLVAIDRLVQLEHESDAAERTAKAALVEVAADFRELHVLSEAARGFEQAADSLAQCSQMVRDYVLSAASPGP